jgi:hypothetical protein
MAWPTEAMARYAGFRSGEMNDEVEDLRNAGYKPVVVGPQPFSFEDLSVGARRLARDKQPEGDRATTSQTVSKSTSK